MDLTLLHNDISFNILSRLPANILVQLKMVSKGWQHFIEDPDFMGFQMKVAEPISISGYFYQEKYLFCNIDIEKLSYIPIRAKEIKIYQNVLEFLPEKVTILGSSNGLVCCRSCIPSPDPLIYICNPMSKKWMNVKWDRINRKDYIAFSFESSPNSSLNESTVYKLVRVFEVDVRTPGKEEFYFTFETYNWERRMWVKSKEICHCEDSLCINRYVLVKGILYWLTDGHLLLMFDIANELSLLITPPTPLIEGKLPELCLGESDGELCCVVVSPDGLMIWALEDCFNSKWDLRSFVSFEVMEEENPQYLLNLAKRVSTSFGQKVPWVQPLAYKDGKLFVRVSNSAYSFDIQTMRIYFLCDMFDLGHEFAGPAVVPYSVTMASVAIS